MRQNLADQQVHDDHVKNLIHSPAFFASPRSKTALVYDWLVGMGGGEKTLDAILTAYPSPIHTLVHDPKRMEGTRFEREKSTPLSCKNYLLLNDFIGTIFLYFLSQLSSLI